MDRRTPAGTAGPAIDIPLSIVIPAYNEERRIAQTLDTLRRDLDAQIGPSWEIIVCDDGSHDATTTVVDERVAADSRLRLIRNDGNRGKGAALMAGFDAARGDAVLFLDADLPVPTSTVAEFVAAGRDADLVTGSRRVRGSIMTTPQPLLRRLGGRTFLWCVDRLGFGGNSDPQCGVKLLRRETLSPVVESVVLTRFAFDVELINRCRSAGLRIVETPVTWTHVEGSTLRPVRDAVATLADLLRLRREFQPRAVATGEPTRIPS